MPCCITTVTSLHKITFHKYNLIKYFRYFLYLCTYGELGIGVHLDKSNIVSYSLKVQRFQALHKKPGITVTV